MSSCEKDTENLIIDEREGFLISDHTVVSDWEAFTADFEELLDDWRGDLAEEKNRQAILPYKGAAVHVFLVQKLCHIALLEGVSRFSVNVENALPASHIGRRFGVEKFIFIKCGTDTLLTLATARLLLGSMAMGLHSLEMKLPVFVEYENGEIIGLACGKRYSSYIEIVESGQDKLLLQSIFSKYLDSMTQAFLDAAICFTLTCKPGKLANNRNQGLEELRWGCKSNVISSIKLTCVFPRIKVDPVLAGLLPEPLDAPIWLLSIDRTPCDQLSTHLTEMICSLSCLLEASKSSMTDVCEIIYSKTLISSLVSHKRQDRNWTSLLHAVFLQTDDKKGEMCLFVFKLVKVLLMILTQGGTDLKAMRNALIEEMGSFWQAFILLLKKHWDSLKLIAGCSVEVDHDSSLLEQKLAMLNYCILRELESLKRIPGYQRSHHSRNAFTSLEGLADRHAKDGQIRVKSKLNDIARSLKLTTAKRSSSEIRLDGLGGSEEEFHDAIDDTASLANKVVTEKQIQDLLIMSFLNEGPVKMKQRGHKEQHPMLKLFSDPTQPMWIPFLQVSYIDGSVAHNKV